MWGKGIVKGGDGRYGCSNAFKGGRQVKVLLIHTCGAAGSVAVADEAGVRASVMLGVRAASEELTPGIRRVLEEAGWGVGELGAVGVVRGPGSFTGVRTGWSVGKGICEARRIPLVGVSRLALLAGRVGLVHAVLDAGRGEFYYGRFRDGACEQEALVEREELVAEVGGGGRVVGCEEKVISGLDGLGVYRVEEPVAGDALGLVVEGLAAGVDDVLGDALYLRRTDAEIFSQKVVTKPAGVGA